MDKKIVGIVLIAVIFLIIGIFCCSNFLVSYVIHNPIRSPVLGSPLDYGMDYSDISFTSDGIELEGWFIPNNNSDATIIIAHGYNDTRAGVLGYAQFLNRAGYNVLLFDLRDHGRSGGCWTSDGDVSNDVIGAINYIKNIKTQKNLDPDRIGALGLSIGGTTVAVAAKKTDDIRAVVTDSAPVGFMDAKYVKKILENVSNRTIIPDISPLVNEKLISFFRRVKTGIKDDDGKTVNIDRIDIPILIIHGDDDIVVPLNDAYEIYDRAKGPKFLWVVEETGHIRAYSTHKEEYEEKVVKFFDEYLK